MPTKGSMVEYLPVGSQEAPQTIFGQKKFQPQSLKSHSQPSVECLLLIRPFFQVSNMFIMSLAIADLTVGAIVMPISSAYAITG